jgi:site-specific recombinase XerD
MADYVASYHNYLENEKYASDNTLSSYVRDVNQFRDWLMGQGVTDLRKVKKELITRYMENLNGERIVSRRDKARSEGTEDKPEKKPAKRTARKKKAA